MEFVEDRTPKRIEHRRSSSSFIYGPFFFAAPEEPNPKES